jgi:hypothetical protein
LLDGALRRADFQDKLLRDESLTTATAAPARADEGVILGLTDDPLSEETLPQVKLSTPGPTEPERLPITITPKLKPPPAPPARPTPPARPAEVVTSLPAVTASPAKAAGLAPPVPAGRRELVGPPELARRTKPPAEESSKPPPAPVAAIVRPADDRVPFAVCDPRLCRKVLGFGAFEPIESGPLRAGQSVLVYCELTGLRYQTREKTHVSRLSSRVELHSKKGERVWEQSLGEAEDECRSRRRDNYLACRLTLPESLTPGEYRLRLIQTDLVARQSASAELPVSIGR